MRFVKSFLFKTAAFIIGILMASVTISVGLILMTIPVVMVGHMFVGFPLDTPFLIAIWSFVLISSGFIVWGFVRAMKEEEETAKEVLAEEG